MAFRQFFIIL